MGHHSRIRQLTATACWLVAIVAFAVAALKTGSLMIHGRLSTGTSTGLSILVTFAYWLFGLAVAWIAVALTDRTLADHPQLVNANPVARLAPLAGDRAIEPGQDFPPHPDRVASVIGLDASASGSPDTHPTRSTSLFVSPQRAQRIVGHAAAERARYDHDSAAWQKRRHLAAKLMTAWLCVLAVTSALAATSCYSRWRHSVYIQHHGVPVAATVLSIENDQDCGRFGCTTTAAVTVRYDAIVLNQQYGQVNYPAYVNWMYGTSLNLLVDPQHPQYAEVNGVLSYSKSSWVVTGLMAAAFTLIGGYALLTSVRHWLTARGQALAAPSA